MSQRLQVDPIRCDARGLCAELVPELISLDEWGYPILDHQEVPPALHRHAARAVAACPTLALSLHASADSTGGHVGAAPIDRGRRHS